ncbi:hypothetical protein ACW2AB_04415 [Limosilactobacillus fermentum]
MKYSEAKSRIMDLLESKYGDEWRDRYKIEEWGSSFVLSKLSKQDNASRTFEVILWVSEENPGCFEACKLGRSEKPLADIFMELALTPLEEREEEKKYVVKVLNRDIDSSVLVKDRSDLFDIMSTTTIDILNEHAGKPVYRFAFTKKEIDLLKDNATLNIDWDIAVEEYDGEI